MKRKNTLFNYLHDALVQQITSGKIAYGEKLPALRSLCDMYNVGIRTVRDVMEALMEEGYVASVQRSHIRVVYQIKSDQSRQVQEVLNRWDSVVTLIKTLEYMMPHIYAEAAPFCDDALIEDCRCDIAGIDHLSTKEQWRNSRIALQRMTAVYHNSLLQDLCIHFDLYAQITIIPGFDNPYKEMSEDAEAGLNRLFDRVAESDYDGVYSIIRDMYHTAADSADEYFKALQALYPEIKPIPVFYSWNAEKGRHRVYMQVVRSIIKEISDGVYDDGDLLPPSSSLREEYGISAYTVGKVMEVLESVGLVKKMNLRGGYRVTKQDVRIKADMIESGIPRGDAVTFLSAVHLIALISRGVALLGFDYLDDGKIELLASRIEDVESIKFPDGMLSTLVQIQPYEPLKDVYRQLSGLMEWGYYFAFVYDETVYYNAVREKCISAVHYMKCRDKTAFAEALEGIYYSIFLLMQKIIVELGVDGAKAMYLPPSDGV